MKRNPFLTTARSKALSKVFLNVSQLLLVGMFLSDAFGKLSAVWRSVAFVVMGFAFSAGIWFATDDNNDKEGD